MQRRVSQRCSGVESCLIIQILLLSHWLTKPATRASRSVVWFPLLKAVETSAMWRRLSIVLGSSANCFWTLDPSRLKPPSRKSVLVSVKQGTHVSQCLAAVALAFPQSFKAGMKLPLARVGRAFVHVSPRVQPALADSSRASRRSVHFGKSV